MITILEACPATFMPFPILIIFTQIAVPLVTGACIGKAVGHTGFALSNLSKAQSIGKSAEHKYQDLCLRLKWEVKQLGLLAQQYGETQLQALNTINAIYKLLDFKPKILDSFSVSFNKDVDTYEMRPVESGKIIYGGAGAVTKAAINLSASSMVQEITRIGFQNTLNSFALYGTKAATIKLFTASTSGLAVGSAFGVILPPALAIMATKFSADTETILTKALEYQANIDLEIARINCFRDKLSLVEARLLELNDGVCSMTELLKANSAEFNALPEHRRNRAIRTLNGNGNMLVRVFYCILFAIKNFAYSYFNFGSPKQDFQDIKQLRMLFNSAGCLAVVLSKATVLNQNGELCSDAVTLFEQYNR
ncbi:hypothetical protein [Dolichospermum compactum]|uniref:Uncharacterized protein n=1 Tax=Dolichospermum compactum NIES-806 TaxID=1973481 RepID=A0A1Z4V3I7_9CYAN|nr:hypothetical protein [Dolichospermum compactum]BAZ86086.1 hypothetical protein NIES806_22930 [Dolichospermum compactum NIES-806]